MSDQFNKSQNKKSSEEVNKYMELDYLSKQIDKAYESSQYAFEEYQPERLNFSEMSREISFSIKECRNLVKSGKYDKAARKCDEAVKMIDSFEKTVRETGDDQFGTGNIKSVIKTIVTSVILAAGVVASIKASSKFYNKKKTNDVVKDTAKTQDRIITHSYTSPTDMANTVTKEINDLSKRTLDTKSKIDKSNAISQKSPLAGAAVVGIGTIKALGSYVKGKNGTKDDMLKSLELSKKTLMAIKESCKNGRRGDARESAFYDGVVEALTEEGNVLTTLIEDRDSDLDACEVYADMIIAGGEYFE